MAQPGGGEADENLASWAVARMSNFTARPAMQASHSLPKIFLSKRRTLTLWPNLLVSKRLTSRWSAENRLWRLASLTCSSRAGWR